MSDDQSDELSSSKLGTLEHWDDVYRKEIENFNDNGDEGEVWFGIQSARRVVNWLKIKRNSRDLSIVDIGCGNGFTCCLLAEAGFKNVTGIDYSEKGIILAKSIAEKRNLSIKYATTDILDKTEYAKTTNLYDIAVDKGTYDAIALSPVEPKLKRYQYKEYLCHILRNTDQSLFIITSCNWTSKELIDFFTENNEFSFIEEIKSPATNFTFGSGSGSTSSTVIFKFLNKHKITYSQ